MLKEKLTGLTVSVNDERIVETFRFGADHVAATLGTKGGPVCAPILSLEIVGPKSLRIVGQGFDVSWDQIDIGPDSVSVRRNGVPAEYRIDGQPATRGAGPQRHGARMNPDKAKAIAAAYVSKHPLEHDDYEWEVGEPRQVTDGWYFDFQSRCRLNIPKEQWEAFAGAPGFVVAWNGSIRVIGWDELPGPTKDGARDNGGRNGGTARNIEDRDRPGTGFHLHPMYIVYAVVAALALAWDWRVLIAFAVLMVAAWIFAYVDDKRHQSAVHRADAAAGDDFIDTLHSADVESGSCPQCNAPLFGVRMGVTTAAEIATFARTAVGWRDNPEALAGWMPPGLYCVNGCYALHATPMPMRDTGQSARVAERVPPPVRITLADVMRDGGSYELHYDSDRGETIKVTLRVITEGALKRVGYRAPCLSRLDPTTHAAIDSWELDWLEAEQLASQLHPLLAFPGDNAIGSSARAREVILRLRRRGKL